MNEIKRVLKIAAWRLFILDLFRTLAITSAAAVLGLIGLLMAQRIVGLDVSWPTDWERAFGAAAGAALVAAMIWSAIRRARGVAVARELDERANLRESLSTALCFARSEDPWAKAVVETARQKAVSVRVNQAIPYTAPKIWPLPFAMGLSLLILWFSVPNVDVLGLFRKRQAAAAQKEQMKEVSNEVKAAEQKLEDALKKAKVDVKDEDPKAETNENGKPQTPDELRRAAVKKLTSLTDKLNELKTGDKAKQLDAMKQMMKQLKQPGPGPLDELTKSMQKGDFGKAQQDLQELAKQMADSKMTDAQREQAKQQMEKLAEQLAKMAQAQEEMQKKLEQAGMSKEQAKQATASPEALQKAMEQLKNMSEAEKKELMKQLQSKMGACKQCQGMSESMEKMAKGAGKQGMSQQGQEGMEAMAAQLSDAEMMDKDMQSLDAAMDEAMKCMSSMASKCNGSCQGDDLRYSDRESPWKAGDSEGHKGGGRGGPGQSGGSAKGSEQEAPVAINKEKAPTRQGQGPIIGSRLVQGDQVRGESVAEFTAAVEAGDKASTEAIETMQVRRELQDSVKHYFGRLEARVKAQQPAAPKPDGK
jgi:hypothetical protein